ncbi:hypothetical protein LLG07_01710 [bacterium]|nr:hypothetical protein [bacterium]
MAGFLENKKIEDMKAVYFIESRSESIIDDKIKEIRTYLKDKIDIGNDLKIFNAGDLSDPKDLYNFLNTPSFFSIKKVVILKNCEKILKDPLKIISDFVLKTSNPNENAVIFLTSAEFKKAGMFHALVKQFGEVITINKPTSENLKKRVLEKVELDGIKITPKALEIFIGNINDDLNILENEYEKLYLYVCYDDKKIINEDIVKRLVIRSVTFTIFNFVDHIGYKNFKMAAELIPTLGADENAVSGVIKQLFLMFKSVLYIKDGERGRNEAKTYLERNIHTNPGFILRILDKYARFARNYKPEEIIKIIGILNDFDIRKRKTDEPAINFLYGLLSKIQFIQ